MSVTTSATERPACRVDAPYPAREYVTILSPARPAASSMCGIWVTDPGVPWWNSSTSPSPPASWMSR